MSWELVSQWVENHPGLASWAQAVFSVLAIFAAGALPIWHERVKEKRQTKNTITSLMYLSSELISIHRRLLFALQSEDSFAEWRFGDRKHDLEMISSLAAEIPASMVAGERMAYLFEIRSSCERARELADKISGFHFDKVIGLNEHESLIARQESEAKSMLGVFALLKRERKCL